MSATLVFRDRGWDVCVSSWSAGSKKSGQVTICYPWGDGIGWTANSTGTASVDLAIDFEHFLRFVSKGGIVDLRRAP